jgi:hypothetical protein
MFLKREPCPDGPEKGPCGRTGGKTLYVIIFSLLRSLGGE